MILALRHLFRLTHPKEKTITLPEPEAVDRIQLWCSNFPIHTAKPYSLIKQVYKSIDVELGLEQLYKEFVMKHKRITFDYNGPTANQSPTSSDT